MKHLKLTGGGPLGKAKRKPPPSTGRYDARHLFAGFMPPALLQQSLRFTQYVSAEEIGHQGLDNSREGRGDNLSRREADGGLELNALPSLKAVRDGCFPIVGLVVGGGTAPASGQGPVRKVEQPLEASRIADAARDHV